MMRILIVADMEGVAGVYNFEQTLNEGAPAHMEARRLMTAEINAAAQGAFDGGAEGVVVWDWHLRGRNVILEEMDEAIQLAAGAIGPRANFLGQGFDAAFLLGFHAMSHTPQAVLCHTFSSKTWDQFWINGRPAGEIAMMNMVLSEYAIPIVLVTGDDKTIAEAHDWLGNGITTAQVKTGLTREGALTLAPKRARALIREQACQAVQRAPLNPPAPIAYPLTVRWQFKDSHIVDTYRGAAKRIDGRTLEKVIESGEELFTP